MAVLMELSSSDDDDSFPQLSSHSKIAGKKRERGRPSPVDTLKKRSKSDNNGANSKTKTQTKQDFDDFVSSDSEDSADDSNSHEKPGRFLESRAGAEIDLDEDADADDEDPRLEEAMETFELPTAEVDSEEPAVVGKRIKELLGVLNNFRKQKSQLNRPRSDFIAQLTADCSKYYGYLPQLIELFLTLFSPNELCEFLEANEVARPVVIRTNTLKARRRELAQALTSRGMNLEPLADWSKVGLKIFESTVPVGATPEYLAGHYMLQSASSFAPVLALDPKPNERILDMASAPGGKTSYIAQKMKNTGLILANDMNQVRIQSTISNLTRMGVRNTIHCSHDGRSFPKVLGGFDRVLLDAPCSGLGVIARDPSVKLQRTLEDIRTTARLQKELLLCAIDSCDHRSKTGGFVVYSTCSISVEENEMVVDYALRNRSVKIVDTKLPFGKPGIIRYKSHAFHPSMKLARRLYPHVHNMDGFFVVKLQKIGPKLKEQVNVQFGKQMQMQMQRQKAGGADEGPTEKQQQKSEGKERKGKSKVGRKGLKKSTGRDQSKKAEVALKADIKKNAKKQGKKEEASLSAAKEKQRKATEEASKQLKPSQKNKDKKKHIGVTETAPSKMSQTNESKTKKTKKSSKAKIVAVKAEENPMSSSKKSAKKKKKNKAKLKSKSKSKK